MNLKNLKTYIFNIMTYLVLTLSIIFIIYLSGVVGLLKFLISLSVYFILFLTLNYLWKRIRKKEIPSIKSSLSYFLARVSGIIFLLFITLGGFAYYFNNISPAPMPTYKISNGEKTVIFQAMSHIGSEDFYQKVKSDLITAKKNGYVYFFEGVRQGTIQNAKNFDKAIGFEFNETLYENFSKLYGVVNQDNSIYFGLVNDLDFNADVSVDYIMNEYDSNKINSEKELNEPINIDEKIIETLASLNERELKVLRFINKAILNAMIKNEKAQEIISNNFTNKELFEIILDGRNEILSKAIIESKYDKIYITYGLLHFKGVFEILKNNDPNWQIIETSYLYPIQ